MRVLVTGASGYIGKSFVKWIRENQPDTELTLIDSGVLNPTDDPEVIQADIVRDELSDLFQVDVVYHLAAWPFESYGLRFHTKLWEQNVLGTARVIDWCVEHEAHLVFSSSVAVYGRFAGSREAAPCFPVDVYGATKYASEMDIRAIAALTDLKWTIIRLASVYGPGQPYCKLRNVFANWIMEDTIRVYGNGLQSRCWTWIGDVLPALWNAHKYPGMQFNVCAKKQRTVLDAAHVMHNLTGKEIEFLPGRSEVFAPWMVGPKGRRMLGFTETVELEEGLATMLAHDTPIVDLDHIDVLC